MAKTIADTSFKGAIELDERDLDQVQGGIIIVNGRQSGLSVVSPRDAASGLPTGKHQHKPV